MMVIRNGGRGLKRATSVARMKQMMQKHESEKAFKWNVIKEKINVTFSKVRFDTEKQTILNLITLFKYSPCIKIQNYGPPIIELNDYEKIYLQVSFYFELNQLFVLMSEIKSPVIELLSKIAENYEKTPSELDQVINFIEGFNNLRKLDLPILPDPLAINIHIQSLIDYQNRFDETFFSTNFELSTAFLTILKKIKILTYQNIKFMHISCNNQRILLTGRTTKIKKPSITTQPIFIFYNSGDKYEGEVIIDQQINEQNNQFNDPFITNNTIGLYIKANGDIALGRFNRGKLNGLAITLYNGKSWLIGYFDENNFVQEGFYYMSGWDENFFKDKAIDKNVELLIKSFKNFKLYSNITFPKCFQTYLQT